MGDALDMATRVESVWRECRDWITVWDGARPEVYLTSAPIAGLRLCLRRLESEAEECLVSPGSWGPKDPWREPVATAIEGLAHLHSRRLLSFTLVIRMNVSGLELDMWVDVMRSWSIAARGRDQRAPSEDVPGLAGVVRSILWAKPPPMKPLQIGWRRTVMQEGAIVDEAVHLYDVNVAWWGRGLFEKQTDARREFGLIMTYFIELQASMGAQGLFVGPSNLENPRDNLVVWIPV